MKTVQFFDKDYLEQCRALSANDIALFLDEFRQLHAAKSHEVRERELIGEMQKIIDLATQSG